MVRSGVDKNGDGGGDEAAVEVTETATAEADKGTAAVDNNTDKKQGWGGEY